jgi:hypothetical protein
VPASAPASCDVNAKCINFHNVDKIIARKVVDTSEIMRRNDDDI